MLPYYLSDNSIMIDSVINTGLLGVQQGLERASQDARRVVDAFSPNSTEDPIGPIVDLAQDQRQVAASAKIIKVGDELVGSILDIIG